MLRDLFASLAPFKPMVAGTYALGIQTESSELDVICEAADLSAFESALRASFANAPGFAVRHIKGAAPAIAATFSVDGLAIAVFGQSQPTHEQHAFRVQLALGRLLRLADTTLRDDIIARKRAGAATEPAFATALGLPGKSSDAVLALESASDADLRAVIANAGFGLRAQPAGAPIAPVVVAPRAQPAFAATPPAVAPQVQQPAVAATSPAAAAPAPASAPAPAAAAPSGKRDWGRVFTEAIANPRLAQEELENQLEDLATEFTSSEKLDMARRLHMKPETVRLANPVTEFGMPDDVLSFYRWCNGGEFAIGQRRFRPIFKMHEIRHYMIEYAVPHFMPTCVPFALDGKGNCYFLDLSTKPTSWVRFGPIGQIGMRNKFRLLVDSFDALFLDSSDPSVSST